MAHILFILDSALIEEETEGQRGKMTSGGSQSNREAEAGFQSGFQTGTPDQCYYSHTPSQLKRNPKISALGVSRVVWPKSTGGGI